jgi:hypothetical protein
VDPDRSDVPHGIHQGVVLVERLTGCPIKNNRGNFHDTVELPETCGFGIDDNKSMTTV